jgi:hypothetical protein
LDWAWVEGKGGEEVEEEVERRMKEDAQVEAIVLMGYVEFKSERVDAVEAEGKEKSICNAGLVSVLPRVINRRRRSGRHDELEPSPLCSSPFSSSSRSKIEWFIPNAASTSLVPSGRRILVGVEMTAGGPSCSLPFFPFPPALFPFPSAEALAFSLVRSGWTWGLSWPWRAAPQPSTLLCCLFDKREEEEEEDGDGERETMRCLIPARMKSIFSEAGKTCQWCRWWGEEDEEPREPLPSSEKSFEPNARRSDGRVAYGEKLSGMRDEEGRAEEEGRGWKTM